MISLCVDTARQPAFLSYLYYYKREGSDREDRYIEYAKKKNLNMSRFF